MEGRKGLPQHWKPYEHFRWSPRTSLRPLFCVVCSRSCPHKQTLKITDRVSVIRPHDRKGLTLLGKMLLAGKGRVMDDRMP